MTGWLGAWGASDAGTPEGDDPSALFQRPADIGSPGPRESVGGGQRAGSWGWSVESAYEREARFSFPRVLLLTLVTPRVK